ncbi:MAG: ATP-binding protein [Chloroflexota bacterium]|nr:ATP-binding protein [Chloroflexota bacterium]
MTPETFEQLISQREGETLEFKQEMPTSSDLAKLITAFYNTRGGAVVFGVGDEMRRLVGVSAQNPCGVLHPTRNSEWGFGPFRAVS